MLCCDHRNETENTKMDNLVAIKGNTYPVKDGLKALGGRWNADEKAWMVPQAHAEAAWALVSGAPKAAPKYSRTTCRECHGPLVNAPHHSAMGGLCGSCAFDEYDM